jgi:hypothetical protein
MYSKEIRESRRINGKFKIDLAPFLKEYYKVHVKKNVKYGNCLHSYVTVTLPRKMFYDSKVKLEERRITLNHFIGCCLGAMILEQPQMMEFVKTIAPGHGKKSTIFNLDPLEEKVEEDPIQPDMENHSLEEEINI